MPTINVYKPNDDYKKLELEKFLNFYLCKSNLVLVISFIEYTISVCLTIFKKPIIK